MLMVSDNYLITSDIHLTDANKDVYRWDVFNRIILICKYYGLKSVFILGDITERKDGHSGKFINKVLDALERVRDEANLCELVILKGNHDYRVYDHPTFKFLGKVPGLHFIDSITEFKTVRNKKGLLIPHQHNQEAFSYKRLSEYDIVFMHQSVAGVTLENGTALNTGVKRSLFSGVRELVVSGDIHLPQKIGNVLYCGAPHPIKFGDSFRPRILVRLGSSLKSIRTFAIQRSYIDIKSTKELRYADVCKGDQIKIKYHASSVDSVNWNRVKSELIEEASFLGVSILEFRLVRVGAVNSGYRIEIDSNITNTKRIRKYCVEHALSKALRNIGLGIYNENKL